jgi:hypothetical protein
MARGTHAGPILPRINKFNNKKIKLMTYCPHCNEFIHNAFPDYSYSDDSFDYDIEAFYDEESSTEDTEAYETLPEYSPGKRSREEAGLEDDLPSTRKKKFLGRESLMEIDQ